MDLSLRISAPRWVRCTVVIVKPSEASSIKFLGTTFIMLVIVEIMVRCYLLAESVAF